MKPKPQIAVPLEQKTKEKISKAASKLGLCDAAFLRLAVLEKMETMVKKD